MNADSAIRLMLATLDGKAYDAAIQLADEDQITRSVRDRRRIDPSRQDSLSDAIELVRGKYHRYNFECRQGVFHYCDGLHPRHEPCHMEPMTVEMLQELAQQ